MLVKGTLKELLQIWPWDKLCRAIHVDYYKMSMISDNEVFELTEKDLAMLGTAEVIESDRTWRVAEVWSR